MPSKTPKTRLTFQPASAERWSDVEELFGDRGACGGCWCMFWRLPRKQFDAGKGAPNKKAFKAILEQQPSMEKMPDPFLWHGIPSAFIAAGFKEVLRRSQSRPIMRFSIRANRRSKTA